jgi:hypothetical protein
MSRVISGAVSDDHHDQELDAVRIEALARGWDVRQTLGGVVAVPHGTELVSAGTPDALAIKLRKRPPLMP